MSSRQMALRRRNRLYRAKPIGVWNIYSNISRRAGEQDNHTVNNEKQTKPKITNTLRPRLCGDNLLTTQRRPQRSLSSQSLGKYWQLNQNNQETEHIRTQTNVNTKVSLTNNNIHKKTMQTERTDRVWFVAFYDIRPGNGARLFLQPWTGARTGHWKSINSFKHVTSSHLKSLQFPHLHVNFTAALFITCLEILERLLAVLGRLLVVLESHCELVPQVLHHRLQVDTQSMLVFQVLDNSAHAFRLHSGKL